MNTATETATKGSRMDTNRSGVDRRFMSLTTHLTPGLLTGSDRQKEFDFKVVKRPIFFGDGSGSVNFPLKKSQVHGMNAVVRQDTNEPLSLVSDRYNIVEHKLPILAFEETLKELGMGEDVRSGLHMDQNGGRFRALYMFPELTSEVNGEKMSPLVHLTGSYDAMSKLKTELNAFKFSCSNLALGRGVLGLGFKLHHCSGDGKDVKKNVTHLTRMLDSFDESLETFRRWDKPLWTPQNVEEVRPRFEAQGKFHGGNLMQRMEGVAESRGTIWQAFNEGTQWGTHNAPSANVGMRILKAVDTAFGEVSMN